MFFWEKGWVGRVVDIGTLGCTVKFDRFLGLPEQPWTVEYQYLAHLPLKGYDLTRWLDG